MNIKTIWGLLKESFREWREDKAARLAAALSYYTAIAIAPLVTGVLAIAGFVFNTEQAQTQLMEQVRTYAGPQVAEMVETILANASQPELARLAGILSLITLLWAASNIFAQLQDSLNTIWGVELRPDLGIVRTALHRLLPFGMVIGIGILMLALIVASAALSALSNLLTDLLPGGGVIWQVINYVVSLAVITLLFALVFKVLPDAEIAWRDVWLGAALTAVLFVVGNFVLSWYLGQQSGSSVYGAAGSLIVLLLWLYYSAQIFFFGAEFTQVYANRYGRGVRPTDNAIWADSPEAQPAVRKAIKARARQEGPQVAYADGNDYANDNTAWAGRAVTVHHPSRRVELASLALGWFLSRRQRRERSEADSPDAQG